MYRCNSALLYYYCYVPRFPGCKVLLNVPLARRQEVESRRARIILHSTNKLYYVIGGREYIECTGRTIALYVLAIIGYPRDSIVRRAKLNIKNLADDSDTHTVPTVVP